jgi:hypothetical protein
LYGRRDFVAFYCAVAVLANLVFCLVPYVAGGSTANGVNGASGCCMALLVLCALYFPHQMVIVFFVPVPLWILASFLVATDLFGFLRASPNDQVAYVVHLAGAGLGALHRFVDLRLGSLLARFQGLRWRVRRGRRAAAPDREFRVPPDGIPRFVEDLENQKLDRLLEKVGRFGRESLTEEEEEFLNRMSQRYRGRR